MYIYIYIYVYIYIYICICIYIYIHTCIHTYEYRSLLAREVSLISVASLAERWDPEELQVYICIYIYVYIYMYIKTLRMLKRHYVQISYININIYIYTFRCVGLLFPGRSLQCLLRKILR
jgi:hypothetical protein